MNSPVFKALLLMSGSGMRFGSSLPKQFHNLSGKKIYLHTLEQFLACRRFDEILLICHPEWVGTVQEDLVAYGNVNVRVVQGGSSRQESSYLGLLACGKETTHVVIHDAVRPFVSQKILADSLEGALLYGAVDTCIPSTDTLVYTQDGSQISAIPPRCDYRRGQTPQSFAYPLILEAHKCAQAHGASDDCKLVMDMNRTVHIVEGEESNIKITSELDLFLAEQLLRLRYQAPLPERSLAGKTFAVVGGTGGIGQALCNLLIQEGATPIVISKTSSHYSADLTSSDTAKTTFDQLHKEHGPIDGLIHSMGYFQVKEMHALSSQEIEQMIAINLTSAIFCSKYAQIKDGGHLVNIASSSYSRGRKGYIVYSAAKAALVNFSQGLAEELPHLKVNVVVPQRTDTPLRRQNFPDEDRSTLLSPEYVAQGIVDLLKAEHVTGSIIEIKRIV